MEDKCVSIILPVYNAVNYIEKTITSVLNQTYKNFELIIVDDGATDGTSEICRNYAQKDYRISYYKQNNFGTAVARNRGIELAKGEYIAFLDHDDEYLPHFLEELLEISEEGAKISGKIRTGVLYVDGIGVGDVGNIVLRDRRNLARDGMVIIVFAIDMENFYLASGPDVITRGFIYARENEDIINEIKEVSRKKIEECLLEQSTGWQVLKGSVRKSVEVLLFEKTKRKPSVFPIIMDV